MDDELLEYQKLQQQEQNKQSAHNENLEVSEKEIQLNKHKNKKKILLFIIAPILLLFLIISELLIIKSQKEKEINQAIKPSENQSNPQSHQADIEQLTLSNEFNTLYFLANNNIVSLNEKTATISAITQDRNISNLHFSSTSKTFTFMEDGEIWQADINGKIIRKITQTNGKVNSFTMSPDEKYIIFEYITGYASCCGNTEANMKVTSTYVIKTDGTGQYQVNYPPKDQEVSYEYSMLEAWYPDSNYALLRGHGLLDTDNNFWELNISNNSVKIFDRYGDYQIGNMPEIYFSPAGDYFLYLDINSDDNKIEIANMDGSKRRILFKPERFSIPVISPNGQFIALKTDASKETGEKISIINSQGSLIYESSSLPKSERYNINHWSSDSRFLIAVHSFPPKDLNNYYDKPPSKILIMEVINKISKEYDIAGQKNNDISREIYILKIAPSNKLYYLVSRYSGFDKDETLPQLWVLDLISGESKKIADNASIPQY